MADQFHIENIQCEHITDSNQVTLLLKLCSAATIRVFNNNAYVFLIQKRKFV